VAGVAADALSESSDIKSDTLLMTLTRLRHGKLTLSADHVVVLDEAGMVPTKLMAELVLHVHRAVTKLVLAGDQGQLQAIEARGPFGSICERLPNHTCQLTQIHRQREAWRQTTVHQFSRGEAKKARGMCRRVTRWETLRHDGSREVLGFTPSVGVRTPLDVASGEAMEMARWNLATPNLLAYTEICIYDAGPRNGCKEVTYSLSVVARCETLVFGTHFARQAKAWHRFCTLFRRSMSWVVRHW
jgi:hypothetical protein